MRKGMLNCKFRIVVLFFAIALCISANAAETNSERNIRNSINEFSYTQMPLSFGKLWATNINNNVPYNVWKTIKSSGDIYRVVWSDITFFDSYQETLYHNGRSYKCGIIILKVNNGEYASLGLIYLLDSNGKVINMRDNWSKELSTVPARAKDSLKSLVNRWLSNHN